MKKINRCIDFQNKFRRNYWLSIIFVILTSYSLAQGKSTFTELTSLIAVNKPLAEVLQEVAQATGYELIINKNWADLPITVKFSALPLDQALKRILANVNHAIVYRTDGRVLISIYEKSASDFGRPGASTINRNPPETIFQPRETDHSLSPNSSLSPPVGSQDESAEPDETPPQPETPDDESEDDKAENENPEEDKPEIENPDEDRAEKEIPEEDKEDKADQNQQ